MAILSGVYSGKKSDAVQSIEIVGVVKDRRGRDLWEPRSDIYASFEQHPISWAQLDVRTTVQPMTAVPSIRDAVLALDNEQPLEDVKLLSENVQQTYGTLRFPMVLVWIFAALALSLSAVGILGVMSYTVSRRTQELAIRMALGADHRAVMSLILREGMVITAFGVLIGLCVSLALSHVMSGYVYGIQATDPLTYGVAALVLLLTALSACYLPARRAGRIDPIRALRIE